jgi:hypothetical protein
MSRPPPPVSVSEPAAPVSVSTRPLPTIVSAPVEPVTEMTSVPDVQFEKVNPDRSKDPADGIVTAKVWVEAVPVIVAVVEILPAPNWVEPNVAVDVPDVLTKVMPSMLTKPSMPLVAAAVRLMLVPAPVRPIWRASLSAPPS